MTHKVRDSEPVTLMSLNVIRERVGALLIDATQTAAEGLGESAASGRAAVALVLREANNGTGVEILLIRRAERSGDPWSGHMAFPGGREEPGDESLLATAIRETREELSLDLTRAGRVVGRLDDLPAMARGRRVPMTIAPFVFELTSDAELVYDSGEVAEAIWAPIEPLLRGRLQTTFEYDFDGRKVQLPAHDVDGRIVWGLTYRMLENLFALIR